MKKPHHTCIILALATTLLASCASTPAKRVSGQPYDDAYERSLRREESERNVDEAMFWQDVSRPTPIHLTR